MRLGDWYADHQNWLWLIFWLNLRHPTEFDDTLLQITVKQKLYLRPQNGGTMLYVPCSQSLIPVSKRP